MTPGRWSDRADATRHSFGAWSFTRVGDEITDLAVDGTVLLRSVRAVVRDRDWATVPVTVAAATETASRLELVLHHEGFGARFDGVLRVRLDDGALVIDFDALARADFDRNRIGLVVLHPPTVAGSPLAVHSAAGEQVETRFPIAIAPHQPALDIAALEWPVGTLAARLDFAGDVFEMEDQRNWTDASFKTYSTPLSEPFPVHVATGERIHQSIRVSATGGPGDVDAPLEPLRLVTLDATMPAIGIVASTAPDPLRPLEAVPADFLLVELDAGAANLVPAWQRALREAGDLPLDVRLVAGDEEELREAVALLEGADVVRVAAFDRATHLSSPELDRGLRSLPAELIGGARTHVTELNRGHERLPDDLAGVTFSVTPQMHAQETRQVVESLPMQRRVVTDALAIAAGRPLHVGPVSLRPRVNAVATTPPATEADDLADGYGPEHVADSPDPRQASPALVAWTIASAAALARPGVASITFFETTGPRGVAGLPVAGALRALHAVSGRPLLDVVGTLPPLVSVLAVGSVDDPELLIANLGDTPAHLALGDVMVPPLSAVRWRAGEATAV